MIFFVCWFFGVIRILKCLGSSYVLKFNICVKLLVNIFIGKGSINFLSGLFYCFFIGDMVLYDGYNLEYIINFGEEYVIFIEFDFWIGVLVVFLMGYFIVMLGW